MATNKNALIRYRTIDKCLQNRARTWTLNDLIDACSDALYEYEGKDAHVSKRTVQLDIQLMRSNKLGFNAPIIVYKRKFYTYEDEGYSITDIPLSSLDMDILTESVEMLSQFKDFSLFTELNGVIQKLEDKIYRESNSLKPIIHLDKNEHLKGLEHLDTLYQAILKKLAVKLKYRSFKSRNVNEFSFLGYILKQFNNRWFLVGRKHGKEQIMNLALDRIISIDFDLSISYDLGDFDADKFYRNTYGVSVMSDRKLIKIVMLVDRVSAPYILTKPFHASQCLLEKKKDGSAIIQLQVHHNFEIERLILGFGAGIQVLQPKRLQNRLVKHFEKALESYAALET